MNIVSATLVGTVVGIAGVSLGGAVAFLLRRPKADTIAPLMALTGGLMLAVALVELLPDSALLGGLWVTLAGFEVGVLTMALFGRVAHGNRRGAPFLATGVLVGGAIALHNLPEGMAIGAGLVAGRAYTTALIITMVLHDIPEGMAVAVPLRAAGMGPARAVLLTLLTGLPTGLGALLGFRLGTVSDPWIGGCLAFAGGAMVAVSLREVLRETRASVAWAVLGAAVGTALVLAW